MRKLFFTFLCLLLFAPLVEAKELDEIFDEVAPNGVFEIPAVKPQNGDREFVVNTYLASVYPEEGITGYFKTCNEEMTECELEMNGTVRSVQVVWQEEEEEARSIVDQYVKKLEDLRDEAGDILFVATDLELVKFYSTLNHDTTWQGYNNVANYSKELKDFFEGSELTFALDMRKGDAGPIVEMGAGGLVLSYQGVAYASVDNGGIEQQRVIYIPIDTENTKEAYMEAAKKRIDEALGNDRTKIEVGGEISLLKEEVEAFGTKETRGDYYYQITIEDHPYVFLIVRDERIVEESGYATEDTKTGIEVSTESSEIPENAILKVEKVEEESEVFQTAIKMLKVEKALVYDFGLYVEEEKLTAKLSEGEFKVSIPLTEELIGKDLVAYYISDEGEVEEHEVTVVDGVATFHTTHFSVYVIAEKPEVETPEELPEVEEIPNTEEVPNTYDDIMNDVFIFFIGLLLLIGTVFFKKREMKTR